MYYCNNFQQDKPDFIEPGVVGAEFTMGAEFSRIYGMSVSYSYSCL